MREECANAAVAHQALRQEDNLKIEIKKQFIQQRIMEGRVIFGLKNYLKNELFSKNKNNS